jgi:tetraacyldisaccharide 4'-kinase
LIYGLIIRLMIFFQRLVQIRLDCKVISVGNITVGGTGKTTVVEYICRHLRESGHKVAIVTRGYKRNTAPYVPGAVSYENMGDEAYMLSKNLTGVPVIVDADRARGARKAVREFKVDTVVFDDGFQQWKIKKDLEIVTIDAANPFGNYHMLPRGILREPLSSLKRADLFILTKANLVPGIPSVGEVLSRITPATRVFVAEHAATGLYDLYVPDARFGMDYLSGKTVGIFCGIGSPDSFKKLVSASGAQVAASFIFPDHHRYTPDDMLRMYNECAKKDIAVMITTEKDVPRVRAVSPRAVQELMVLKIELRLKDEKGFIDRLLKLYSL